MATSSDGVVTATVDSVTASIRLTVDFTASGSSISGTAASSVYAVTVTEQTSGRTVRGLTSAAAPGGAQDGIDHEATFDFGLSYVATAYGATGNVLATSAPASITLPSAPGPGSWLKSLTTPAASVNLYTKTLPAWAADIAQGVIQVVGRPDPIVVSDVRQYETATVELWTRTGTETAALKGLLATPGPYLLQMPQFGEADVYVTVGKYQRPRPNNVGAGTYFAWSLPLQQVARPNPLGWRVAIPGKTYADSAVNLPLYSNRTGTYLSRSQ